MFDLTISKPVDKEKSYILQKKALYSLFERSFETGRMIAMKCSRLVFIEVVLLQIRSTKTHLEPSIAKFIPVLKLLSDIG